MPRTGRRPGTGGTRDKILGAARAQFARAGFEAATVRSIASEAGVDPALVLHYFGSKRGLFRAAVDFPLDPALLLPRLLEPGVNGLGERLVRFFLETWDSPAGRPLLALIRSAVTSDDAALLLREFVSREVLARVARALDSDEPRVRVTLAATALIGLAMLRYVVKVEPLASAPVDDIAALLGPTVQRHLSDALPVIRNRRERRR